MRDSWFKRGAERRNRRLRAGSPAANARFRPQGHVPGFRCIAAIVAIILCAAVNAQSRELGEILRLVDGLQATDAHGVATPADWKPGDPVIVPPPATDEEAAARLASGEYDCTDWFFCKKAL